MTEIDEPRCSPLEERVNAWTHGVAAAIALMLLVALIVTATSAGEPRRLISVSVFGVTLVLLYVASACYHACAAGPRKRSLRTLDHASIFLLIAGSYTPFLVVLVRGVWGWTLLAVLWTLAAFGVTSKMRSIGKREWISTAIYIAMGWIGVCAAKPFFAAMPGGCIAWVVAGGVAYTAGVAFYAWDRLPFNHGIWHLFVAAGSACHVVAVVHYVLPVRPA